jgi:uroporphyrinogen-III synthase
MNRALAGRAVLVTRPAGLSARLSELLAARGCEAILLPAIEILPPDDPARLEGVIGRLESFQIAIFVSPTAVARAHAAVAAWRSWPAGLRYAAIGSGTAGALRAIGIAGVIAPEGRGDSAALAALPELADVAGQRIVIFRGQDGRDTLRVALVGRGAQVEYAECYRRSVPKVADIAPLLQRWGQGGIDAVSITSAEGLGNLFALLGPGGAALLRTTPVFVPHPRVADAAHRLGVARVIVTEPADDGLVEALAVFFARV